MKRYLLAYALAVLAVCALLSRLEERKATLAPQPSAARAVEARANG